MPSFRVVVRVTPGARKPHVGGSWQPTGTEAALRVAVAERAIDGAATRAVCTAVAKAFGVAATSVRVVSGETSRSKVLLIEPSPADAQARLQELLTL